MAAKALSDFCWTEVLRWTGKAYPFKCIVGGITKLRHLVGPCKSKKEVTRKLSNIGVRLYAMLSGAHSEEYIACLRGMDEIMSKGDSDTHSSRRHSWS